MPRPQYEVDGAGAKDVQARASAHATSLAQEPGWQSYCFEPAFGAGMIWLPSYPKADGWWRYMCTGCQRRLLELGYQVELEQLFAAPAAGAVEYPRCFIQKKLDATTYALVREATLRQGTGAGAAKPGATLANPGLPGTPRATRAVRQAEPELRGAGGAAAPMGRQVRVDWAGVGCLTTNNSVAVTSRPS